jgi:quercetin dioxygenase-like cupin family protein
MMESEGRENEMRVSRILRFHNFRWDGVEPKAYKDPDERWSDVKRHGLIGSDTDATFRVRYFEVGPGGYTTHERHRHEHVVVAIRGSGEVRLEDRWEPVGFGDVVYVSPNSPHQFRAVGEEPFGFLCIVDAERDRPVPL